MFLTRVQADKSLIEEKCQLERELSEIHEALKKVIFIGEYNEIYVRSLIVVTGTPCAAKGERFC